MQIQKIGSAFASRKLRQAGMVFIIFAGLMLFLCPMCSACTTTIVTPGASESGAMFVSHSDDGHLGDARLMYVPAEDHKAGSSRPVYFDAVSIGELPEYASFTYCRYTGTSRGPDYENPGAPQTEPLGYIPQVSHTYAYYDGNYGIMNEHQLMFGECTDGSKTDTDVKNKKHMPGPKRLFYSAELARVALERCKTSKEAVKLIGDLIDTYGYYGTGETLPVADPKEAWVIEMVPGPKDVPGLWVAQKVPDGEVFVAANELRIREIDPDNPDQLYGRHLYFTAEAMKWWKPEDGKLDWLRTVSKGEYNHPYYSLRRVWRLMTKLAPSRDFSPWVDDGFTTAYPFSIKPDKKLARKDVMSLHRDHYEGTEFDMTKGVAAGPFGCPYRILGPYDAGGDVSDPSKKLEGAWERPLSVYYCTYVFVCEGRSSLPDPIGGVLWFGNGKPSETCFTPFYVGSTAVAAPYKTCDARYFTRDSAFWAFNFVENWAALNYKHIHRDIESKRNQMEKGLEDAVREMDQEALAAYKKDPEKARAMLTEFSVSSANDTFLTWQAFGDLLVAKYADGGLNYPGKLNIEMGYPKEWRDATSWPHGPIKYDMPDKE
ncbi:Dipeptidase [Desulfatibacillum alkenivorans DSM 16219]|jgi:dipeptidase|uniref:Dipeptidase n=1 Tax=Desulfatibacillum alkenivorans DSM 16219 TaxID=1121393 RepID=A0A1M6ZPN7_9BACT|nr:C69 family dipeptidase [Desulfatibacillum alkenivorans]SHL32432.1 Dipeptidase [Desulfatibacillum alkenivorans DSM 16219]